MINKTKNSSQKRVDGTPVEMHLYIAKNAPNSVQAIANLALICKEHLENLFTLEIIDVLESPLRAMADGILVTPSLTRISPSPVVKIVGNLSDSSSVMLALGINV